LPLCARTLALSPELGVTSSTVRAYLLSGQTTCSRQSTVLPLLFFKSPPPHSPQPTSEPMSPTISATTQVLNLAELVREVLSHLGPADLARAMRVDSFWREEGQGQLYTSVQLSIPVEDGVGVMNQVESFVNVVTSRAELATKVDAITLHIDQDPVRHNPRQSQLEVRLFAACRGVTVLRLRGQLGFFSCTVAPPTDAMQPVLQAGQRRHFHPHSSARGDILTKTHRPRPRLPHRIFCHCPLLPFLWPP